jgi:hypothetical protein
MLRNHRFEQNQGSMHVGVLVGQRILKTRAYAHTGCEMNDGVKGTGAREKLGDAVLVADVEVDELECWDVIA